MELFNPHSLHLKILAAYIPESFKRYSQKTLNRNTRETYSHGLLHGIEPNVIDWAPEDVHALRKRSGVQGYSTARCSGLENLGA